jgi:hypothetical protein
MEIAAPSHSSSMGIFFILTPFSPPFAAQKPREGAPAACCVNIKKRLPGMSGEGV